MLQSTAIVRLMYIKMRFIFGALGQASFLRNIIPGIPMGRCSRRICIGAVLEQTLCPLARAPRIIQHGVVGVAHYNALPLSDDLAPAKSRSTQPGVLQSFVLVHGVPGFCSVQQFVLLKRWLA